MSAPTHRIRSVAGRARRAAVVRWQSMTAEPLPADHQPVFILGHQKAGTSVIAALLGEYAGLEVTVDLKQEIRDLLIPRIVEGDADLEDLIRRNRDEFAPPIVKHPNLTWIYPQLRERFPRSQFVFVVRDPRDNARSILDRLQLPGDASSIAEDRWSEIPRPWRLILGEGQPGWDRSQYLEAMADRWAGMAKIYLEHQDDMALIRYEDFKASKQAAIAELAESLGLPSAGDISGSMNQQFQGKGAHRDVPLIDFFGPANLGRIEDRCRAEMVALDYRPIGSDDA